MFDFVYSTRCKYKTEIPFKPFYPFKKPKAFNKARHSKPHTQFLVREGGGGGKFALSQKNIPSGQYSNVQPEGSYFWDGAKMLPLITRNC